MVRLENNEDLKIVHLDLLLNQYLSYEWCHYLKLFIGHLHNMHTTQNKVNFK